MKEFILCQYKFGFLSFSSDACHLCTVAFWKRGHRWFSGATSLPIRLSRTGETLAGYPASGRGAQAKTVALVANSAQTADPFAIAKRRITDPDSQIHHWEIQ
eukprot:9504011-Pyramimonas_sp.AAC.4